MSEQTVVWFQPEGQKVYDFDVIRAYNKRDGKVLQHLLSSEDGSIFYYAIPNY